MYQGIDTAAHISAAAAIKLKAEGIAFAGRYLVPPGMNKELTAAEARDLRRRARDPALLGDRRRASEARRADRRE